MSSQDVDRYLEGLLPIQRAGLEDLREKLLRLTPGVTEAISYSMPAVVEDGKVLAGYAAFKNHLGYFPHSSIVISRLEPELTEYKSSKGGFQFGFDQRLPIDLVQKLVNEKRKLIAEGKNK